MAGWSMLEDDGSSLIRCNKNSAEGDQDGGSLSPSRPLPPLLGDGKAVDLLKLFVHVKKRGGYDVVSRDGLWESVGEDQGLSCPGVGSAIKLVYYKYLRSLESELMNVSGSLDFRGLKADLKAFAPTVLDARKKDDAESEEGSTDGSKLGGVKMDPEIVKVEAVDMDSVSSGLSEITTKQNGAELTDNVARRFSGPNGCEERDAMVGDSCVVKEESSGQKRKRESLSTMLSWMAFVAKDPTNPVIGSLPDSSKWDSYANDNCWKRVLLARKALFLKKTEGLSPEQFDLQKKQKMHPSMFDDYPSTDRVRSSRRLLYGATSLNRSNRVSNVSPSTLQKRIPVGQFFQADVPEWTGIGAETDPKWLGTRIWPPEESGPVSPLDQCPTRYTTRGGPCGCQFPGSTACIKLHISRSRMKLKGELGSAFYHWKFDKMGEEAAVSWTAKEEQKFEAVVKENPLSLGKCFWAELPKSLPNKSREELVSYYYNVFLLRQRGRQNRYDPSNIDSDDDETEFIAKSNSLILSPGKKRPMPDAGRA